MGDVGKGLKNAINMEIPNLEIDLVSAGRITAKITVMWV